MQWANNKKKLAHLSMCERVTVTAPKLYLFWQERDEVLRTGDVNVVVDDHVVAH